MANDVANQLSHEGRIVNQYSPDTGAHFVS
jgi:hypothetical protein